MDNVAFFSYLHRRITTSSRLHAWFRCFFPSGLLLPPGDDRWHFQSSRPLWQRRQRANLLGTHQTTRRLWLHGNAASSLLGKGWAAPTRPDGQLFTHAAPIGTKHPSRAGLRERLWFSFCAGGHPHVRDHGTTPSTNLIATIHLQLQSSGELPTFGLVKRSDTDMVSYEPCPLAMFGTLTILRHVRMRSATSPR
jgi:hypothetical protein